MNVWGFGAAKGRKVVLFTFYREASHEESGKGIGTSTYRQGFC